MRPKSTLRTEPGIEYSAALGHPSFVTRRPTHHTHKRTGLNRVPLYGAEPIVNSRSLIPKDITNSYFGQRASIHKKHPVYGPDYKHFDDYGDWNFKQTSSPIPIYRFGEEETDEIILANNYLY